MNKATIMAMRAMKRKKAMGGMADEDAEPTFSAPPSYYADMAMQKRKMAMGGITLDDEHDDEDVEYYGHDKDEDELDALHMNKGGMCYAEGGEVEAMPNLKEKYDDKEMKRKARIREILGSRK
jgi:hypothetical protein